MNTALTNLRPSPVKPVRPIVFDQGPAPDHMVSDLELRATISLLDRLAPYAGDQLVVSELLDSFRGKLRRVRPLPVDDPADLWAQRQSDIGDLLAERDTTDL